jgi:hypothetical protein
MFYIATIGRGRPDPALPAGPVVTVVQSPGLDVTLAEFYCHWNVTAQYN